MTTPGKLDRTVVVGTEGAGFCLFHPDDLRHRQDSGGWMSEDFACGAEFDAGTFVGWETGGDGGFLIRVTDGDLTPREAANVTVSWDFRYRARRGRVLLDNGDHVPPTRYDWPIDDDLWFEIPDGDYCVTIYGINEEERTDGGLPEYVVRFRPVRRLEQVKVRCRVVQRIDALYGEPKRAPRVAPAWAAYEEDAVPLQRSNFRALALGGRVLIPGFKADVEVPQSICEALQADPSTGLQLSSVDKVILARRKKWAGRVGIVALRTEEAPTIGTLGELGGFGYPDDAALYSAPLLGRRLVRVTALERSGPALLATVESLTRPESEVSPRDLEAIKAAFAAYAKRDPAYRTAIPHPDYEVERVVATDSPAALTNILLHHVQLTEDRRSQLLPLSDADRVRELLAFLERAASGPS